MPRRIVPDRPTAEELTDFCDECLDAADWAEFMDDEGDDDDGGGAV